MFLDLFLNDSASLFSINCASTAYSASTVKANFICPSSALWILSLKFEVSLFHALDKNFPVAGAF